MNVQKFWDVIGNYNRQTWMIQLILLIILVFAIFLSYTQRIKWAAKFVLGIVNLWIGIVFFAKYGTEPIQTYFALPLYVFCGGLFLYESWHNRDDSIRKPSKFQIVLLILYCIYPVISILLGHSFPKMVTYIMPCPIVSLSIVIYAGYKQKNKVLLTILTIWGLTGIKAILFHAYEDSILLICGLYGIKLLVDEIRQSKSKQVN